MGEHVAVIALRRPIIRLAVFGIAISVGLALLPWQDASLGLVLTHRMAAVPVPAIGLAFWLTDRRSIGRAVVWWGTVAAGVLAVETLHGTLLVTVVLIALVTISISASTSSRVADSI